MTCPEVYSAGRRRGDSKDFCHAVFAMWLVPCWGYPVYTSSCDRVWHMVTFDRRTAPLQWISGDMIVVRKKTYIYIYIYIYWLHVVKASVSAPYRDVEWLSVQYLIILVSSIKYFHLQLLQVLWIFSNLDWMIWNSNRAQDAAQESWKEDPWYQKQISSLPPLISARHQRPW